MSSWKTGRGQGSGHNLPSEELKADLIEAESRSVIAGVGEGGEGLQTDDEQWHRSALEQDELLPFSNTVGRPQ